MGTKEILVVPEYLKKLLAKNHIFQQLMMMQGEAFRDVPGRRTIKVSMGSKSYFIKQHSGLGWKELCKNLLSLKKPIISARTEWQAIQKLDEVGIPTTPLVAYGERGCNPATIQSFVLTQDLGDIVSLETLCADWPQNPPDARLKRQLIMAVAKIARTLHDNGLNHRDFYICHFCLDKKRLAAGEVYLYLIDLHRVGIHTEISNSARMKDMAALYFSAMHIGLSERDLLRFVRSYSADLRHQIKHEARFWRAVSARARKLYLKFHGKMPAVD